MESLLLHGQFALSTTLSSTVTSWCDLPVSCAVVGLNTRVTWCGAFKFCVLPTGHTQCYPSTGSGGPYPALPQVTFCPATLAEAATQLSFVAFLERCIIVGASSPPQLPVPTPPLDVATQTYPHTAATRDVSNATLVQGVSWLHLQRLTLSALRVLDQSPLYLLIRLCRRLYTASQFMMPPHNYRSRSSFSGALYPMTLWTVKHCHRHIAMLVAPHLHKPADIATLCSSSSASHASDGHEHTTAPRVSPQPPPGLEKYAHLSQRHRRDLVCVHLSQSRFPQLHVSTTQVGTHHVRSATTYKRSASTARAGTHNPVGAVPRAGTGPFPKPRALVRPMVKFGQSKPDGLGFFDTVDSDLMHHQYRLSVLQWNPGPARRNPTNSIAVACGKFHAVNLQEASNHILHISHQFIAHTGNTDLAILLNKDTFQPDPTMLVFKEDSTSKGTWGMVLLIVRALLCRPSLSGAPTVTFLLCTHPQCSGQET